MIAELVDSLFVLLRAARRAGASSATSMTDLFYPFILRYSSAGSSKYFGHPFEQCQAESTLRSHMRPRSPGPGSLWASFWDEGTGSPIQRPMVPGFGPKNGPLI